MKREELWANLEITLYCYDDTYKSYYKMIDRLNQQLYNVRFTREYLDRERSYMARLTGSFQGRTAEILFLTEKLREVCIKVHVSITKYGECSPKIADDTLEEYNQFMEARS